MDTVNQRYGKMADRQNMKKNMAGKRFGRLVALEEAGKGKQGAYLWRCRCDCGRETIVSGSHLRSGHTRSCGCYSRELAKAKGMDLTGKRFGRLTVLDPAPDKNGVPGYWHCLGDCGKEVICYKENLCSGVTKSCGCLQAETRKQNMKKAIHFVDGTCIEKIAYTGRNANNTSGQRGVYRRENGNWRAMIGFKGKVYNLGTFKTYEEAVEARLEAEKQYYLPFLKEYEAGQQK